MTEIVLVTGGQGFLGQHLIKCLQQDDRVAEIRVLDNESFSNRIGFEENKRLKSYVADITKPETLNPDIFQEVDCVFHLAASTGFSRFKSAKVLEDVNVNGTRNVILQCIGANVGRLVFTSTTHTVVPKREPLILAGEHTAAAPPKSGFLFGHYGRTKLEAENLVRKANGQMLANGSGTLSTVCLRPTVLYGELDPYYVTSILKMAKANGNTVYKFGWGGERNQSTYAGNAAWAHVLAKNALLDEPKFVTGEAIFITDDTLIKAPFDFFEPFLKLRNMKFSSMQFSATFAVLFTLMMFLLKRLLKPVINIRNRYPHPGTVFFMTNFYCFNRLKATLRLGYKPKYDPEESMTNSLEYYKQVLL